MKWEAIAIVSSSMPSYPDARHMLQSVKATGQTSSLEEW